MLNLLPIFILAARGIGGFLYKQRNQALKIPNEGLELSLGLRPSCLLDAEGAVKDEAEPEAVWVLPLSL